MAKLENDSVLSLDVRELDLEELEYVEKLDIEGIFGGLGSISDGSSLELGEALRFFELVRDLVDGATEAASFCFFSRREDLLVTTGVDATVSLLEIVSFGWTFSSKREVVVGAANVLEGSVVLRTP